MSMLLTLVRDKPTMDYLKVFGAGIIAFGVEYLWWVPESLKFIILLATAVYVVYRMAREMRRFYTSDERDQDK